MKLSSLYLKWKNFCKNISLLNFYFLSAKCLALNLLVKMEHTDEGKQALKLKKISLTNWKQSFIVLVSIYSNKTHHVRLTRETPIKVG